MSGLSPIRRTVDDIRNSLLTHFRHIVAYQSDRQALLDMRRVGCWYLKLCSGAKGLRMQINQAKDLHEMFAILEHYNWDTLAFTHRVDA